VRQGGLRLLGVEQAGALGQSGGLHPAGDAELAQDAAAAPGSPSRSGRTLRHAFMTAALDAGVSLRGIQEAASHADPRSTMRYDRARASLDRHATYIVTAYLAGAAR
jgi:integrase